MEKEKIECCSENQVHPDLLKIVNDTMPEETELYDLAELFKVFGDSTRIRILFVLFEADIRVQPHEKRFARRLLHHKESPALTAVPPYDNLRRSFPRRIL